jgi:uncharacterized protein (DUF305 family)
MLTRSVTVMAPRASVLILIAVLAAACRTAGSAVTSSPAPPAPAGSAPAEAPPIVQPGAPGKPGRVLAVDQATDLSRVQHTGADVKFMQGMIGHHRQAIEMTDLLKTRTASDDMKKLAMRIDVSQADEINMMTHWLQARGQEVPSEHAMHLHGATLMPGMLTPEEMAKLAAAKGVEFDRLFLEGMIRHHAGALTMVKELFATPGAGQEAEIFAFASDVDADQRMEIDRMGAMLNALMKERKE